jgi:hypothetical protein
MGVQDAVKMRPKHVALRAKASCDRLSLRHCCLLSHFFDASCTPTIGLGSVSVGGRGTNFSPRAISEGGRFFVVSSIDSLSYPTQTEDHSVSEPSAVPHNVQCVPDRRVDEKIKIGQCRILKESLPSQGKKTDRAEIRYHVTSKKAGFRKKRWGG